MLSFRELLNFLPLLEAAALISAMAKDSFKATMSKAGLQLLLFLFPCGILIMLGACTSISFLFLLLLPLTDC